MRNKWTNALSRRNPRLLTYIFTVKATLLIIYAVLSTCSGIDCYTDFHIKIAFPVAATSSKYKVLILKKYYSEIL